MTVTYQSAQAATPPNSTQIKTTQDGAAHVQHVNIDSGGALVETRANTAAKALTVAIGPTDPISDIPVVIEFDHHQVHEGESHGYSNLTSSLASGANKDFRITPSTDMSTDASEAPHMVIEVVSTLEAEAYLYEDMTYNVGNGGTAATTFNRNRTSATAPGTAIYYDPTPAGTGTNLWIGLTGSSNRAGGLGRALTEWILHPGKHYLFRVTSRANTNKVLVRFEWYEDLGV